MRLLSAVIGLLLVFGLYFPTEATAHLSILMFSGYAICLLLLAVLMLRRRGSPEFRVCLLFLLITPLLLAFTFVSGLSSLRLGALLGYGTLSILYITNVRDIDLEPWFEHLWVSVNIINILAGFAIILGVQTVNDFIIAHYSMSYDELVPSMLAWHKPVLTFGTHSAAAFFLYLFFWLNLQAYRAQHKRWLIVFSVCYLFLMLFLTSVSAVVFCAVASIQLAVHVWSTMKHKFAWSAAILCVLLLMTILWNRAIGWRDSVEAVAQVLQNPNSGLWGRYLPGGTMYDDLVYLEHHPLLPVGASFKEGLLIGDSGFIEYMVRGSFPLLFLVYGGLFHFLRRNFISKSHAYFLFAVILAFEIGYTMLVNARTLCLIPAFVVYLNGLSASRI